MRESSTTIAKLPHVRPTNIAADVVVSHHPHASSPPPSVFWPSTVLRQYGGPRLGLRSGTSHGSPMPRRYARTLVASVTIATSFMRPLHFGHLSTSMASPSSHAQQPPAAELGRGPVAARHGQTTRTYARAARPTGGAYVACALAHQACRKGHRALYRRVPRLFDELRLARAEGVTHKLFARFARADVLVLDDFAMAPMLESERRDLLEIIEDRHGQRATILTSQLPPDKWHDYLADPTVADAICDRILHHSPRIALKGPSRRKELPGGARADD